MYNVVGFDGLKVVAMMNCTKLRLNGRPSRDGVAIEMKRINRD